MAVTVKLASSSATLAGPIHAENEDAFLADDARGVYAVADGLGGHAGGATASRLAVAGLSVALTVPIRARSEARAALLRGYERATERLRQETASDMSIASMGTTLTALVLLPGEHVIAHVGDTRVYVVRERRLERLTQDHSVAHELFEAGVLTPEQLATHPGQRILTRALRGQPVDVDVDVSWGTSRRGDLFILCSDGLPKALPEARILELALETPFDVAPALVEAARSAQAEDDVTVVAVRVE